MSKGKIIKIADMKRTRTTAKEREEWQRAITFINFGDGNYQFNARHYFVSVLADGWVSVKRRSTKPSAK